MLRERFEIKSIKAREILDSRGNPTVETELEAGDFCVSASVPSGASCGKYEAQELRDGGKRYQGRGVLKAIRNIQEVIAPKLKGKDVTRQKEIDNLLIELDGTEDKSKLGANAILAVSMAAARAGARAKNIPLYQHIAEIYRGPTPVNSKIRYGIPIACFNIINGGVHAGNDLDFQEFMIVPAYNASRSDADKPAYNASRSDAGRPQIKPFSFSKTLQASSEIYHTLKEILKEKFGESASNIGDEGGFAPPLFFAEQALDLILEAIRKADYENKVKIILDAAASEFYKNGKYKMKRIVFTKEGLLRYYLKLIEKYPIIGIEDPFAQDDWQSFQKITKLAEDSPPPANGGQSSAKTLIIGDDLLVTNIKRLKEAQEKRACKGLILKPNQIGTITEAIEAARLAKSYEWKIMVSHRSGETNDDFISDLAVGIGADFIKAGAPARGERVAKYNRLLRIEEELEKEAEKE